MPSGGPAPVGAPRALALVCSLKRSPTPSSSELLAEQVLEQMRNAGARCESIRCVDYAIKPGVAADMGPGDQWPQLREKALAADILVLATPVWLGHLSSVAQRVLERLDAELSNTDDAGRPTMVGKVAVVAVVGNEDGAHKVTADAFQALNDIGYTISAQASTYWNGEAMQTTDYRDLDKVPDAVASATAAAARNAVYLAGVLRDGTYPPYE
ncbi:flavodoxin family protein [Mycobacterium sherrisii]|uniref:flavodoxin family protein n=1 Tax=Mycobacterium sherrisii TaxID=243061 RepID=UPI000A158ADA|nr:NAD(P)H-dependent oxidoreductase [Mycobacterium sherrisii]MCV7029607.1 flavodoxin family protein [Mycobacterium sherrisii]ORW83579.1 flavodoxin [Mycobacterium sherrisii]